MSVKKSKEVYMCKENFWSPVYVQRNRLFVGILMDTQLKQLVLYRKCRGKVVLPNLIFTDTQLKNTNIYLTFMDKKQIPHFLYVLLCCNQNVVEAAVAYLIVMLYCLYTVSLWIVTFTSICLYNRKTQHIITLYIQDLTFVKLSFYINS